MILYPSCQRDNIKTDSINTLYKAKILKKNKKFKKKSLTKKNKKSIMNKLYQARFRKAENGN